MRAASGDDDALDGGLAGVAGFAGAHIDAVLKLEESFFAIGVDVIGDRRAPGFDGFLQDHAHCFVELAQLLTSYSARSAAGADTGAEERFVGVDVSDSA